MISFPVFGDSIADCIWELLSTVSASVCKRNISDKRMDERLLNIELLATEHVRRQIKNLQITDL
jgi:hypothetical protein